MRLWSAGVFLAVLAMLAAGCGGSADGDTGGGGTGFTVQADTNVTTAPSMTRAGFVVHVNDLCRRKWPFVINAVRQTRNFTRKLHPQTTELQQYMRGVHESYFAAIDFHIFDMIYRMGAPPGEKEAVENLIGTMQEGVERGQQMQISTPAQVEALFTRYNRVAREYGLDECLVEGSHLPYPDKLSNPGKGLTLPANSGA
jgi:hypothetical protein